MSASTAALQQKNAKHLIQSFSDLSYIKNPESTHIISRADGVYIYDNDGKKILDSMSGLWCVNMGYGQQSIIDAVNEQMKELVYYNNFFGSSHPSAIKLSEMIADKTPEGMNKVYFCGSGSEANDTVVRLVRHYWAARGNPSKSVIISRTNAYHGSTMAGASLGGMSAMHSQGGLPIADIEHVEQPYYYDACVEAGGKIDADEYGIRVAQSLEKKIDELGEDRVAAFIAEPIQGAGGVIIPPKTYWPEISRICKERNILLVADEVICGFGRTGEWFGSDTYNIKPDIITMAKGISSGYIPLSGIMVGDRVTETLVDEGGEFYHGYTYSGHPVACAVAIENIKIIREENLIENSRKTSVYLKERMNEIADHPLVGEVRMKSFIGAVELVKDKDKREMFKETGVVGGICRDYCIENGLVMRAVRDGMIFCPPLIFNNNHIDELVDKLKKSLDQTHAHISKS